jgi:eukaryotic-like serine/threonine-protein kinase
MVPFGKQQEILRDLSTSSPEDLSGNSVAMDMSNNEPVAGVPHLLFQTHIIGSRIVLFQYAVSADGKRFLINSTPSIGAAPLTVLMN